jgi:predicted GNAT family acetyltransferase
MLALTAATKPGPFFERTIEFGNYIGIFEGDELLAMAGERLQLDGFTEASAICTKPGHNGKGYASCLLSAVAEIIIASGDTPFLHVKQDNDAALAVYKKLGFEIRRATYFAVFRKKSYEL